MFFAPSIFNLLTEHISAKGEPVQPVGHVLSLSSGKLGRGRVAIVAERSLTQATMMA